MTSTRAIRVLEKFIAESIHYRLGPEANAHDERGSQLADHVNASRKRAELLAAWAEVKRLVVDRENENVL